MPEALRKLFLALAAQIPLASGLSLMWGQAQQHPILAAMLVVLYELAVLALAFWKKVWAESEKDAIKATADWVREHLVAVISTLLLSLLVWLAAQLYSLNREVGSLREQIDAPRQRQERLEKDLEKAEDRLKKEMDKISDRQDRTAGNPQGTTARTASELVPDPPEKTIRRR